METSICTKLIHTTSYAPVDNAAFKTEFLVLDKLKEGKARTTYTSPVHSCILEDWVFGEQNDLMLKMYDRPNHWIRWGVSKEYGGFHAMIEPIERLDIRDQGDVSRWDKTAPLSPVYAIRKNKLLNYGVWMKVVDFVAFFNIHPVVLLPTGEIIIRKAGNDSGKMNTTSDNCILHFVILLYGYLKRLHILGFDMKLNTVLDEAYYNIYSDDKLGGCTSFFEFHDKEEFEDYWITVYSEFGMLLKKDACLTTYGPGRVDPKHEFLGSFCHYDELNQMYIPSPRLGKVCSSFVFASQNKNLSVEDEFRRYLCLTVLLFPNDQLFQEALSFLRFYMDNHKESYPLFKEVLGEQELDLASKQTFQNLYLGFESQPKINARIFACIEEFAYQSGPLIMHDDENLKERMNSKLTPNNVLQTLMAEKVLNERSRTALIAQFDPSHDVQLRYTGSPTMEASAVYAAHTTLLKSIGPQTAPFVIDPALPYSIVVRTWPVAQTIVMKPARYYGSMAYIDNDEADASMLAPVTISYQQGANTHTLLPRATSSNPNYIGWMEIPLDLLGPKMEIGGMGVEMINTTPNIQKGGSVVTCSYPQSPVMENINLQVIRKGDPDELLGNPECRPLVGGIQDQTQMMQYPNVFYGGAENGIYARVYKNLTANVPNAYATIPMVYDQLPEGEVINGIPCYVPEYNTVIPYLDTHTVWNRSVNHVEMDSTVVWMTNLPPGTTFDVRVPIFLQTFPSRNVSQMSASQPAVGWNEGYYELCARLNQTLKSACYFTDNPGGEWFKSLLRSIVEGAPAVLAALPDPRLKAMGATFSALSPALLEMLREREDSKAKRKQNNQNGKYGPGMKKDKNRQIVKKKQKPAQGAYTPGQNIPLPKNPNASGGGNK